MSTQSQPLAPAVSDLRSTSLELVCGDLGGPGSVAGESRAGTRSRVGTRHEIGDFDMVLNPFGSVRHVRGRSRRGHHGPVGIGLTWVHGG